MANILITGSKGQLGSELRELLIADKSNNYHFTDLPQLDISNAKELATFLDSNQTNLIVNCAAYTAVDKAEDEAELAMQVNGLAPGLIAGLAAERGITLIHISTDYVFDGKSSVPYKESFLTNPTGVYGKSKLLGESGITKSGCRHIIIRTSWLYSAFGNNFAKTIIRLASERNSLNVVFDQVGTPTYATDLAKVITEIIKREYCGEAEKRVAAGVFHYSNEGVCSWYDFAVEILKLSGSKCKAEPVTSDKFPSKAKRPDFSVLDKGKIKSVMGITIPHWRESLNDFFLKINDNE